MIAGCSGAARRGQRRWPPARTSRRLTCRWAEPVGFAATTAHGYLRQADHVGTVRAARDRVHNKTSPTGPQPPTLRASCGAVPALMACARRRPTEPVGGVAVLVFGCRPPCTMLFGRTPERAGGLELEEGGRAEQAVPAAPRGVCRSRRNSEPPGGLMAQEHKCNLCQSSRLCTGILHEKRSKTYACIGGQDNLKLTKTRSFTNRSVKRHAGG